MACAKLAQALFLASLLILALSTVHSRKVLVFVPGFTDGQIKLFVRLGDLLTNSGHNVTLFRPQYNPDVRQHDPKSTGVKEIRYTVVEDATVYRQWLQDVSDTLYRDTASNLWSAISYAWDGSQKFALDGCDKILRDSKMLAQLKNERFDVAVVEAEDVCAFGLVRVLAIPAYTTLTSGILSDHLAWITHVPSSVSFVPNSMSQFSDRMSLGQRVQNLVSHALTPLAYRKTTIQPTTALFRKHHGKDFPDLEQLIADTPIVFVNDDELVDFPRPILHKVIFIACPCGVPMKAFLRLQVVYVGGFGTGEDRPLSGTWKKLMDQAQDGVILISFGNVVKGSDMPLKWKVRLFLSFFKVHASSLF